MERELTFGVGGGAFFSVGGDEQIPDGGKNWFSYAHWWIGKKEILVKISEWLCWNLFIGATAQIRAV